MPKPIDEQNPPPHMTPDEFRALGHRMVDWIADYMRNLESMPVQSPIQPGDLRRALPVGPPEQASPDGWDAIFADLDDKILPALTHWQHPGFFAYFPCNASGPAILGELASAGLNVNGMLWSTSPAVTELETHVLDWCVDLFGLPEAFKSTTPNAGGVIQGTASEATLVALLAARQRERSAAGRAHEYCVFASEHAHSSIAKAAMIAGIADAPDDARHVRLIPADADGRMNTAELARQLRDAIAAHNADPIQPKPIAVVASLGTTSTGAIDPLDHIAEVIVDTDPTIWLHADAAWAGPAAVCPEHRDILSGADRADSLCLNMHKWGLTNFDCDLFYTRDVRALTSALSITPEYLRNAATDTGGVIDYRDWQVPLGRRFRALKLWFVLRHYGADGLCAHIRRHVAWAAWLEEQVMAEPRLSLAAPRSLSLVCLTAGSDERTEALLTRLNRTGRFFLSHTRLPIFDAAGVRTDQTRFVVRISVGTASTQRAHIEALWHAILRELDAIDGDASRSSS